MINAIKQFIKSGRRFNKKDFGKLGELSSLSSSIILSNPKNIFIDDHVTIGSNAILYATNAKIIIKKYFVSAYGLKISTGQHERRIGRFLASISEKEKNHNIGLDKDVIINEDVWAGFDVTIMAGVEIGRGVTIAAGSVVTHSLPAYCVAGGVPAKVIKFYWSIEQILEHEKILYSEEDRLSELTLRDIFYKYADM
ncbi:acyltransferase [Bacteroides thetaiotaomicron]|jgi:galactoside O-acetyltransferase|uniref:acyltransferase n=1 Tax=Bacteroides thetaiotaomicron TaxID=818 RepID=UPI0039C3661D